MKNKTKMLFVLLISTVFFGTVSAKEYYQAMNCQAHDNRSGVSLAEENDWRDYAVVPSDVLQNPCAPIEVIKAITTGPDGIAVWFRAGIVSSAEQVRAKLKLPFAEITFSNFEEFKKYFDDHQREGNLDFGAEHPAKISGTVWDDVSGKFVRVGWQQTTIKGVHKVHYWDFTAETGNPTAIFPYGIAECGNLLHSEELFYFYDPSQDTNPGMGNTMNNQQEPAGNNTAFKKQFFADKADEKSAITQVTTPDGKTQFNLNINIKNYVEGAKIERGNGSASVTPITLEPAPAQVLPPQSVYRQLEPRPQPQPQQQYVDVRQLMSQTPTHVFYTNVGGQLQRYQYGMPNDGYLYYQNGGNWQRGIQIANTTIAGVAVVGGLAIGGYFAYLASQGKFQRTVNNYYPGGNGGGGGGGTNVPVFNPRTPGTFNQPFQGGNTAQTIGNTVRGFMQTIGMR